MKKGIVVSVVLVAVTGGGFALMRSSVAAVSSVRVAGVRHLDPSLVREASGIEPGMNALTLDLEAAAARVREIPLVESAQVQRDGAFDVVIAITERAPRLILATALSKRAVDADAVPMAMPPAPVTLPVLQVDSFNIDAGAVKGALRVWSNLSRSERQKVRLRWGSVNGLWMELGSMTVRLGNGDHAANKLNALRELKSTLESKPRRVDLSQLPRIGVLI
jgi:cell division protein FtsQ